jgi:hypothetical protein
LHWSKELFMPEATEQNRHDIQRLFDGQSAVRDVLTSIREDLARIGTALEQLTTGFVEERHEFHDHRQRCHDRHEDILAEWNRYCHDRLAGCHARMENCEQVFKQLHAWQTRCEAHKEANERLVGHSRAKINLLLLAIGALATVGLVLLGYLAMGK